ncbi:hypothetical protein [Methanosarcina horonobensis]|uniref:hypothetical protein n=1 Tax=Methanosarcina horonobensis TaxID=418008 RepID=UPI00064FC6AB|nr:hypothetical protein [Methanosarcina horonobensis]
MYNETFLSMLSGENFDLLGFFVAPYTNLIGNYFWLLVGFVPVVIMFLKSQDVAIPLMCGLLFTAAFGFAFPHNLGVALIMLLGTGIGAMLFKTFKGVGN